MATGGVTGLAGVLANLAKIPIILTANYTRAAEEIAALLQEYALANHPWKDDTGDTTASIVGAVTEATATEIVVAVAAGMDYDVFVELARGGQWAWLWPCVLACQPEIMAILGKHSVLGGVSGGVSHSGGAATGPMQGVEDAAVL